MQQDSGAVVVNQPQGRVVGNRIVYNNDPYCHCNLCLCHNLRGRIILGIITTMYLFFTIVGYTLDVEILGLMMLFCFLVAVMICIWNIYRWWIQKQAERAMMQNVTHNQPTAFPSQPQQYSQSYPGQPPQNYPVQPQSFPGQPPQSFPGQPPQSFPGQPPQSYPGQPPQNYPVQPQSFLGQPPQSFPGQPPHNNGGQSYKSLSYTPHSTPYDPQSYSPQMPPQYPSTTEVPPPSYDDAVKK